MVHMFVYFQLKNWPHSFLWVVYLCFLCIELFVYVCFTPLHLYLFYKSVQDTYIYIYWFYLSIYYLFQSRIHISKYILYPYYPYMYITHFKVTLSMCFILQAITSMASPGSDLNKTRSWALSSWTFARRWTKKKRGVTGDCRLHAYCCWLRKIERQIDE